MKKFISIFMIMAALMCALYIGVAAEPNNEASSSSAASEESSEISSNVMGVVSIDGGSSSEEVSSEEISSEEVSSEETSSTATSSRYGANAYDPTIGQGGAGFGNPESDTTLEYESKPIASKEPTEKNMFNLSKLLKGLIFIPIVLILASIGALIYVNRKEFAGAKTKKGAASKNSGKHTRKKVNKDK